MVTGVVIIRGVARDLASRHSAMREYDILYCINFTENTLVGSSPNIFQRSVKFKIYIRDETARYIREHSSED